MCVCVTSAWLKPRMQTANTIVPNGSGKQDFIQISKEDGYFGYRRFCLFINCVARPSIRLRIGIFIDSDEKFTGSCQNHWQTIVGAEKWRLPPRSSRWGGFNWPTISGQNARPNSSDLPTTAELSMLINTDKKPTTSAWALTTWPTSAFGATQINTMPPFKQLNETKCSARGIECNFR